MTVNLFVKLPTTQPGITGGEYFDRSGVSLLWALSGAGGPSLRIHTWIAFILVIGAIALFVQSLRSGGRGWRWASGIAALFTLGVLFNGLSFMDYNEEFSSAIMAGCWLTAVTALVTPLVRTRTTVAAEFEIATDGQIGVAVPQEGRQVRHIWGHTTQPSNMPMLCHKGTVIGLVATNGVPASIRSMELIRAGYWKSDTDERWPDPRSMVDPKLPEAERDEVVSYLRRGFVVRLWMGYSPCRICGANNGDLDVTDGVYIWPDGLAHYVDAHNVRLPTQFTEHIQTRLDEFENPIIDDSWWRSL